VPEILEAPEPAATKSSNLAQERARLGTPPTARGLGFSTVSDPHQRERKWLNKPIFVGLSAQIGC
jgi:hypothetical protein